MYLGQDSNTVGFIVYFLNYSMKIAFVWQGWDERFSHWNDGLRQAMRIIEEDHTVTYYNPWDDNIQGDVLLYWEAPCTINGKNAEYYNRVRSLPIRKALLFAGGPLQKEWVIGFDLLFVESEINAKECRELNIPYRTAFGINDSIFKPMDFPKVFKGIHHGTCASWKRQGLVGEALGKDAILVGRWQPEDPQPFRDAQKAGAHIVGEMSYETVNTFLNLSECLVQTSDFWGGGQRATLEAMAVGLPVVCMTDSPKNREYVEACGAGVVCEPNVEAIREAVYEISTWSDEDKKVGIDYVRENWTARHYALSLLDGICELQ
jgi:glycosyltransferase involved in cell wall biosynthesis